jgi:pilus assembly protein CpaB
MKTRGLAIGVAVALAAGATFAVFLYVQSVKDDNEPVPVTQNMIQVIVPKQDIPAGANLDALISAGAFTTVQVPATAVVPGAITDLAQLQGRATSTFVLQGEQISTARLQGSKQPTGGVLGIPAGHRAVSIQLEGQRVVNGVIQPGDHVTLYVTLKGDQGQKTSVVVPDVMVLETTSPPVATANEVAGAPESGGAVVTLALKPQDSGRVILAQEEGSVWLSLLPPNEHGKKLAPVTLAQLGEQ